MVKYNFNAGPSILPEEVIKGTAEAVLNLNNSGLSVLEISHRSKDFQAILDETTALFKELLNIPEGYSVLFLGGGASMEFCRIPFNFLNKKAAYIDTGIWSHNAIKEAKAFGEVEVVASSEASQYDYIPKKYDVPADADYLHYTTNNTVYGTQFTDDLEVSVPLIADMSSDIFSRPVDVSKYICIYGGAQKNIAPSGVAFVIVKDDALGKVERSIPTILDYKVHASKGSLFNTPPVLPIYSAMLTLRCMKKMGGVEAMQKLAIERSQLLYKEIDRNTMFVAPVKVEDRSKMNIRFVMSDEYKELEKEFLDFASAKGIVGIKGHRTTGGFRASCYNAMPIKGVEVLRGCMQEFEKLHMQK